MQIIFSSLRRQTARRRQRLWLPFLCKYFWGNASYQTSVSVFAGPFNAVPLMIQDRNSLQSTPGNKMIQSQEKKISRFTSSLHCGTTCELTSWKNSALRALRSGLPEPSVSASLKSRLISLTYVVEKKQTLSPIRIPVIRIKPTCVSLEV